MIRNGRDKSVFVGYLFEELAAHFFGGEITDRNPYVGNRRSWSRTFVFRGPESI